MASSFYEYLNSNDQTIVLDMMNEYRTSDPYDETSFSMNHAIPCSFSHVGNDYEISDSVIKHINQVLMEEEEDDMEPYMLGDSLVLKATEEALYQVIKGGDQYPLRLVDQNEDQNGKEMVGSDRSEVMSPDAVIKNNLIMQFKRGVDDGSKFLPPSCQLIGEPCTVVDREAGDNVVAAIQKNDTDQFCVGSRGKKSHEQSTDFVEDVEAELSDKFDKALLGKAVKGKEDQVFHNVVTIGLQLDMQLGKNACGRKRGNMKEANDLRGLLISCAEAVGADDRRTASVLLKQIRHHSTPIGDYSQRLAHWFANALEARLAGTGFHVYTNWSHTASLTKRVPGAEISKFFRSLIAVCPFMKMIMIFANHMILKVAEKADKLHIIDFGVRQGLQWPALIHCLSKRPGGPPKLRITRMELAISGIKLDETLEEPGHCLASYCKRFNVPFEYQAITDKWETLQLDDLKAQINEVVVVHCLCRFKYLLDETVMENSPRDTVLKLIRKLNPDIFVQSVVNGSHDAPFFVRRFREALIHFSAYFDMLDTTLPPEDQMRMGYEKEFIGREVLNIIACEGTERIVRPETYKQWQIRNTRAGFTQLPLDYEIVKKIKDKVKSDYHKCFVVEEDGHWLLQGWKGKMMNGIACWRPTRT